MLGNLSSPLFFRREKNMSKVCIAKGDKVNGKYDINTSSILTTLIREAGKNQAYASDLFIDWLDIEKQLENGHFDKTSYVFGFRDFGVDGETFVMSRLESPEVYGEGIYRSIYALSIEAGETAIAMGLSKIYDSNKGDFTREIVDRIKEVAVENTISINTEDGNVVKNPWIDNAGNALTDSEAVDVYGLENVLSFCEKVKEAKRL